MPARAPAPSENEQRAEPRIAVPIRAAIQLRSGAELACTIRDLSPSGARIAIARTDKLPARFFLRIAGAPRPREVVLRWQEAGEAGVQFVDAGRS
jgi:hypothetical protein